MQLDWRDTMLSGLGSLVAMESLGLGLWLLWICIWTMAAAIWNTLLFRFTADNLQSLEHTGC